MNKAHKAVIAAAVAVGCIAPLPAAVAKDGRDVLVRGTCTDNSSVKLKLSPENGKIEAEFEVDQNRNGVSWNWTLRRPGLIVAKGTAVTRAPSGSFEVRRVLNNRPGTDRITARATRANGAVCTATASF